MTSAIAALLDAGRPFLTTSDLAGAGLVGSSLQREIRRGRLIRLARGTYVVPAARRSPTATHLLRAQAMLDAFGGDAVLTHHSALVAHGLPVLDADLDVVHLGRTDRLPWRSGHTVMHRLAPEARPTTGQGLAAPRAVTPAHGIVQAGLLNGPHAALAAADSALRLDLVTDAELTEALTSYRGCRNVAAIRTAIAIADAAAESPGESALRYDLTVAGYATVTQPIITVGGRTYRPDLQIVGTTVLVEFDGLAKYDDPAELRRERDREATLREAGWEMVRFQWSDLGNTALMRRRIEAALARGRRQPVRWA